MKKSIFENLSKAMEEDAKDPNGVMANFIKEEKERKIQKKEFYESERFNEILDLFNYYEIDSIDSEHLAYCKPDSIFKKVFKDTNEFLLFCESIVFMNKDKSVSPDACFTKLYTRKPRPIGRG